MSGVRDAFDLQWEVAVLIVITVLVIVDLGKHAILSRELLVLIPMGWALYPTVHNGRTGRESLEMAWLRSE